MTTAHCSMKGEEKDREKHEAYKLSGASFINSMTKLVPHCSFFLSPVHVYIMYRSSSRWLNLICRWHYIMDGLVPTCLSQTDCQLGFFYCVRWSKIANPFCYVCISSARRTCMIKLYSVSVFITISVVRMSVCVRRAWKSSHDYSGMLGMKKK